MVSDRLTATINRLNYDNQFQIRFCSILDLTNESFTIGRSTRCDYTLRGPEIKSGRLSRMSKRHFQITRDLSRNNSPAYIGVIAKRVENFIISFIRENFLQFSIF